MGIFYLFEVKKRIQQSVRSKLSADLHISIVRNTECLQIHIGFFHPLFFQEGTQITKQNKLMLLYNVWKQLFHLEISFTFQLP